ncbi:phage tail protein [uncultured Bradyrhizobium sp.]|jgi:microcystin-dependent protein|uniref:phage tail protein n=1 Tax=uncultured Bradyrhizobium sp. TaxID=199684 RepID=UPI002635CCF1|nr:phage tail protein [uncultured Bradyrhizobium sp.]
MTLYRWSQTASADATADSTINWAEGQSPASVNDSARAMMAAIAKYRDDVAGAIVTTGTSTAYAVSTYQVFQSLAQLNGQMIAFTPHATNGATVTINVDSLGGKPLRSAPSAELPVGVLIQGTPYVAVYNHADQAFYLRGFYGSPYLVPIGGLIDYTGAIAPNSAFIIPAGQPISRSTYTAYFALVGTTFGSGDGSTTFNVPDLRGRVVAMLDSSSSVVNSATIYPDGNTRGATGGGQTSQLVTANLPPYTPTGTIANGAITISPSVVNCPGSFWANGNGAGTTNNGSPISASQAPSTFAGAPQGGVSAVFTNMQPTMMLNKILRII